MKKSVSQPFVCCFIAVLVVCGGVYAADLGLVMPEHTNSYLPISQVGGTLMYGSGHAMPLVPDSYAYYYLSGAGLGRGAGYSGTVAGRENLLTLNAVLSQIDNPQPLGIKFITSGTNDQGWNLGDDVEGEDWSFNFGTYVENRIYTAGNPATVESALFYGDQKIIIFDDSNIYMILNYLTGALNGYTDTCGYVKAAGLEGNASDVADAFIADFDRAGGAVLLFDSIDPIFHEDGFAVINGSPAPLYYATYTWVGRIQTAENSPVCNGIPVGDLNFDCCVNLQDLVIMALNWGECNWGGQMIQ